MNANDVQSRKQPVIKVFGVGGAGMNALELVSSRGLQGVTFVAVSAESRPLEGWEAGEKVHLDTAKLSGLGTVGDPDRGRALAEEHQARLTSLCEGADVVFLLAGLGGGAGSGMSPVLARAAKATGALVVAFVITPFECEGKWRGRMAQLAVEQLKEAADAVICLPNQKVAKLRDEATVALEIFQLANDLLADGVRGIWRMLTQPGLIEVRFSDMCGLMRDRHAESAFAVAEAMGPTRSREVTEKLLSHPLLDGGEMLNESEMVLVSLTGGPDLTMAEVERVMQPLNERCAQARVMMGAAIDPGFQDRLAVTLIAARPEPEPEEPRPEPSGRREDLGSQLLGRGGARRPGSRFVPPPPALPPEKLEQMARQRGRVRKVTGKLRQGQLPLEIVSKGRFDKSEPTIHKGEDLDVPTYIRRGVALN